MRDMYPRDTLYMKRSRQVRLAGLKQRLESGIFGLRIKVRTGLADAREVAVTEDLGIGIVGLQ